MGNNNFVVKFPIQATAEQKARIMSAMHLVDLVTRAPRSSLCALDIVACVDPDMRSTCAELFRATSQSKVRAKVTIV